MMMGGLKIRKRSGQSVVLAADEALIRRGEDSRLLRTKTQSCVSRRFVGDEGGE